jgi:hypothetical protein
MTKRAILTTRTKILPNAGKTPPPLAKNTFLKPKIKVSLNIPVWGIVIFITWIILAIFYL